MFDRSLIGLAVVALRAAVRRRLQPRPEEPEPLSVTRWTDKTELFAEYPPLVVGETSRFAIHLTRLDTFKALTDGHVEVRLRGGAGQPEVFRVDAPSRPGIFGVDVKPAHAGKRELVIVLQRERAQRRAPGRRSRCVSECRSGARAAAADGAEDAPGISFLKEQQWSLDFGTARRQGAGGARSIRVPARLEARPGGAADVVAPIDGRLTRVVDVPLGASVSRGQELARLLPPPARARRPAAAPARARGSANGALALADARSRARRTPDERWRGAGRSGSTRRARAEEQAKARLAAAEASLAQYNARAGRRRCGRRRARSSFGRR